MELGLTDLSLVFLFPTRPQAQPVVGKPPLNDGVSWGGLESLAEKNGTQQKPEGK